MPPHPSINRLRCLDHLTVPIGHDAETGDLVCSECGTRYPVTQGVPNMMRGGPASQDWNAWDMPEVQKIGHSYYKRAKGELPEKEASKSLANFLANQGLYSEGGSLLDIGCATGHFLRSLRTRLDENVRYTGIDTHLPYLVWGAEIFGVTDSCSFVHSDALELPFPDDAFDIVFVNLFHFFHDIRAALGEACRVARKHVVWRTPIGETNYVVKVVYDNDFDDIGVLLPNRDDVNHTLYMMYSERYLHGLIEHLGHSVRMIERDTDFEAFDNTALKEFDGLPSTKVVNGMQINGQLILDWHYVVVDCA